MAGTTRPTPAAPPLLKRLNEQTVLELVRDLAPVSRAEISRRAGISKPTVSLALRTLVEAGLVRESADAPSGPSSAPSTSSRFRRRRSSSASISARGSCGVRSVTSAGRSAHARTSSCRALTRARPRGSGRASRRSGRGDGPARRADPRRRRRRARCDGLRGRDAPARRQRARARGAALRGRARSPPRAPDHARERHQPGRARRALAGCGARRGRLRLPLGRHRHGGRDRAPRRAPHGRHGFAGEIDFALDPLDEDVDPAAPQIAELAAEIAEQHDGTSLRAPFDARSVFGAARQGDEAAQLVVDEVARRIALHLAPVAAVVDVELVVLGGGIGSNGDLLLAPVRQLLALWLPFRRRSRCRPSARPRCSQGRSQWASALRWRRRAHRGGLSATVPAWLGAESS